MSEKPSYRHSFLNPARTEKEKLSVNRFGHTILGGHLDENVLPHEEMEVSVDPSRGIVATRKAEIFEHPAVQQWARNAGIDPNVFMEEDGQVPEDIETLDDPELLAEDSRSLFDRLPANIEELIRESQVLSVVDPMKETPAPPRLNRASPQDVQITLPAHLSFPQPAAPALKPVSQRCSGCQGDYPEGARFCPHCGMALARFCIQCGYQFLGSEKFCPDCGTRR